MAVVKPFKALRFTEKAGKVDDLICPPYDIISEDERLAFIKNNENNIIRLELPKEGVDPYKNAGEIFKKWKDEGILAQDDKEAFYLYDIDFTVEDTSYTVSGIIGRVQLTEFSKGVVLPHEETLSKAKDDRFNLFKATNCNFSQIYSLYIDNGSIANLVDAKKQTSPDITSVDCDGLTHKVWIVTDREFVENISLLFEDKKLYIADGHHRYETSINYRNYLRENKGAKIGDACDDVMMFLADMNQDGLVIFPTHRIVRDLKTFDADKMIENCKTYFEIKSDLPVEKVEECLKQDYKNGKTSFALYLGGDTFTMLTAKVDAVPETLLNGSDALRGLDVSILHSLVLEDNLCIDRENMAKQINLRYTRSIDEAIESVKRGEANCTFLMNPTRVNEIKNVALAGEKMPQKSTYFYPKLTTGLIMNEII